MSCESNKKYKKYQKKKNQDKYNNSNTDAWIRQHQH